MDQFRILHYVNQFPAYYKRALADSKRLGLTPAMIRNWAPFIISAAYDASKADVKNQDLFERGLTQIFDGLADLLDAGNIV